MSPVRLYNSNGVLQKTLEANTKIAISSSNSGTTRNELISINKVFNNNTNQWENPLASGGGYIEYKLELGCMPNNRVINN